MPDEQDKTVTAEKPKVKIEVFAWLTRYVGGDGGGRKFYTEEFSPRRVPANGGKKDEQKLSGP